MSTAHRPPPTADQTSETYLAAAEAHAAYDAAVAAAVTARNASAKASAVYVEAIQAVARARAAYEKATVKE